MISNNKKKYRMIKNSYLCQGLSFLGFHYFKFNDKETGETIYSFEDTEKFKFALDNLYVLKEKINKNYE